MQLNARNKRLLIILSIALVVMVGFSIYALTAFADMGKTDSSQSPVSAGSSAQSVRKVSSSSSDSSSSASDSSAAISESAANSGEAAAGNSNSAAAGNATGAAAPGGGSDNGGGAANNNAANGGSQPAESQPPAPAPAPAPQTTVSLSIDAETMGRGYFMPQRSVVFQQGESVFDVLKRECKNAGIPMEFSFNPVYNSAYIEGINNLYEFDGEPQSGWMYCVNGWYPNYGCSAYSLSDGDVIRWRYTCNLGADVGGRVNY